MNRRLVLVLALATILAVSITAIAASRSGDSSTDGTTPPPHGGTGTAVVDWEDGTRPAAFPGGWSVRACDGDAPILCVSRDGVLVGTVEAVGFRLDLRDDLDDLVEAGDDAALLDGFVRRFAADTRADRAEGCGPDYVVTPFEPQHLTVDGRPGVAYGFTGGDGGTVTERMRGYATVAAGRLVLVVVEASDPGGCFAPDDERTLFTTAALTEFEPVLARVVAESELPLHLLDGTPVGIAPGVPENGAVVATEGGLDGGRLWFVWDGARQRIAQPRAISEAGARREGIEVGDPVTGPLGVAAQAGRASFAVHPEDGPSARLYLLQDGVLHLVPVVVDDAGAVLALPVLDVTVVDRVEWRVS